MGGEGVGKAGFKREVLSNKRRPKWESFLILK